MSLILIYIRHNKNDGCVHEDIYRKSKKYEYKVYKWTGISNEAIESRKKTLSC